MSKKKKTTAPVRAGDPIDADPEFVRVPEVQRRAGIKRGLCYRKIKDGTFRSILVREPGNKSGVRLVFWPSVRNYLHQLLAEQDSSAKGATSK